MVAKPWWPHLYKSTPPANQNPSNQKWGCCFILAKQQQSHLAAWNSFPTQCKLHGVLLKCELRTKFFTFISTLPSVQAWDSLEKSDCYKRGGRVPWMIKPLDKTGITLILETACWLFFCADGGSNWEEIQSLNSSLFLDVISSFILPRKTLKETLGVTSNQLQQHQHHLNWQKKNPVQVLCNQNMGIIEIPRIFFKIVRGVFQLWVPQVPAEDVAFGVDWYVRKQGPAEEGRQPG